jgi:hypothetical protein
MAHHLAFRPFAIYSFAVAILGALGLAGCQKKAEVREYTVKNPAPPEPTHRMLVAVVPQEAAANEQAGGDKDEAAASKPADAKPKAASDTAQQAWFFKLVGPIAHVDAVASTFDQFVGSVRTSKEGRPTWTLPEGWVEDKSGRASGFGREATIRIGEGTSQLELAVSKLPMQADKFNSWLLVNVNRWREQMKLPPIALTELDEQAKPRPGEPRSFIVDLQGTFSGAPMAACLQPEKAFTATGPEWLTCHRRTVQTKIPQAPPAMCRSNPKSPKTGKPAEPAGYAWPHTRSKRTMARSRLK